MASLLQLPIPEEIYDLDTFFLKEVSEKIQLEIQQIDKSSEKSSQQLGWLQKARKVLDLATQEIDQRKAIQNFGEICQLNEDAFFTKLQQFNPYAGQLKNWQNLQTSLITPEPIKQAERKDVQKSIERISSSQSPDVLESRGVRKTEESRESYENSRQLLQSNSQSDFSDLDRSGFTDASEAIYNRNKNNIQHGIMAQKKNDDFAQFMKKTLEATQITDNRTISSSSSTGLNNYNFDNTSYSYQPTVSQSKSEQVEHLPQIKKNIVQNENNVAPNAPPSASSGEYAHVTSKVQESINTQTDTSSIYFTTGKPLFSNRFKPKPKQKDKDQNGKQKQYLKAHSNNGEPVISKKNTTAQSAGNSSNNEKSKAANKDLVKEKNSQIQQIEQESEEDSDDQETEPTEAGNREHSQKSERTEQGDLNSLRSTPLASNSENFDTLSNTSSQQNQKKGASEKQACLLPPINQNNNNSIIKEDISGGANDSKNSTSNNQKYDNLAELKKNGTKQIETNNKNNNNNNINSLDKDTSSKMKQKIENLNNSTELINEQIVIDNNQEKKNDSINSVNSLPNSSKSQRSSNKTLKSQIKKYDDKNSVHKEEDEEIVFKPNGEIIKVQQNSIDSQSSISNIGSKYVDQDENVDEEIQQMKESGRLAEQLIIEKGIEKFSPRGNGVVPISEIVGKKQQIVIKREEDYYDDDDDDDDEIAAATGVQVQPELFNTSQTSNAVNALLGNNSNPKNQQDLYQNDQNIKLSADEEENNKQELLQQDLEQLKEENIQKTEQRNAFTKRLEDIMNSIKTNLSKEDENFAERLQDVVTMRKKLDEIQTEVASENDKSSINQSYDRSNNQNYASTVIGIEPQNQPKPPIIKPDTSKPGSQTKIPSNQTPQQGSSQKQAVNSLTHSPEKPIHNQEEEKQSQQIAGFNPVPQPAPAPSVASKLLAQMMGEIKDENLIDYTHIIPTFSHLFSSFYNNQNASSITGHQFSLIDTMKEIFNMFSQHVERVDRGDQMLVNLKTAMTPLEVTGTEVYYMNDPRKVMVYSNRVNIDMKLFIERQIILTQRSQGLRVTENLMPHEQMYFRVVKNKQEVYDIITRSFLRKQNWNELPHGMNLRTSWNLLWTWSKPQIDMNKLLMFQKVNHFTLNQNMARKDLLKKNFDRISQLGARAAQAFDVLPLTFILPKDYCAFSEKFYDDMQREGPNNIWIMKPVGKSRGRGISLINEIAQVVYAEPVVVQKYMKNPLLLKGHKFDMRIYVLVTSMKPLEVFLYQEGFARLSTELFTLDPETIKNNFIHLTNYAIQKHNVDTDNTDNFIGGSKITLQMLRQQLQEQGIQWSQIWTQVHQIIIKSLIACQQDMPHNPNCFQVFGYDIIIDSDLRCWLLEINSSPSLARDFIIDDLVKQHMIDDSIDLVDPIMFDRERLCEVLDRRIREEQGNQSSINTQNNSQLQLNRDLNYILRGKPIRPYGELPKFLGGYEMIAPSEMSEKFVKLVQGYKVPSVKNAVGSHYTSAID